MERDFIFIMMILMITILSNKIIRTTISVVQDDNHDELHKNDQENNLDGARPFIIIMMIKEMIRTTI